MIAVADTGFVVAMMNDRDRFHQLCLSVYVQQQLIYLPQSTLTEIAYLLNREVGTRQVADFLEKLARSRYQLIPLSDDDIQQTSRILRTYADTRVDFVDASIAAIADRLNIRRILTLDYRDFRIIRPSSGGYFDLLPTPPAAPAP